MTTPVIRAYQATIDDVKPGERSVVAKINGRAVDRHRTIIEPSGINLENYRKNPVVLWEHGRDPLRGTMPVGRNQWIKSSGDGLIAKTIFRDDAYSSELFRAYQDGDLKGWSVNVLSHDAGPPTSEEIRACRELADCDMVYRRTELAEYSAVAIPSYRDALTVLAARGIWIPDDALIERYITHSDGKWTVHAEDGKPMGTYDSKEAAEHRLREIEYFKHKDRAMTDSMGGLAGGGAAVKPGFVRKKGSKYIVYDGQNQPVSEHDDPAAAQSMLGLHGQPARSAPEPEDGGGPRIECDGTTWVLRMGGAVILADPDPAVIEAAAGALAVSRTWDDVQGDLMARQAAAQERVLRDFDEHLQLKLTGHVGRA